MQSDQRREQIRQSASVGDVPTVARMLDEAPELLTGELWPAAVFQGRSLQFTQLLLNRGLDPNISSAPRRAIDLAVYLGLADIVELLVSRGADCTSANKLGERPLDLLDAYEPRPLGDPGTWQILAALLSGGATLGIHHAVRIGDAERVRAMLDADPTLLETPVPWPPLFSAARSGRVEVAKLLIARGANVNATNSMQNTALWFACQSPARAEDRIAVATLLIDAGARVRQACEDGTTALHFAAWRGPIAMVELLIRHGAKEWQPDSEHRKPIDHARRGGAADREQIIELLDRPVIRDSIFKLAVGAIQAGDVSALQRLLADQPNLVRDRALEPDCYPPSYFSNPKLLWFVANNPTLMAKMPANMVDIAAAIIDAGAESADLNYTLGLVMTSLPARAQNLQRPLMKLLLSRGAIATPSELHSTLGHGERDAIAALLESGVPLTAPLAAGMGMPRELAEILPAATTEDRHAALSLSVINRELECARLCLEAGADPNQFLIVHAHSMPIHQATVNDDVPMLKLLVEHSAKLDSRDKLWNGTPLGWANHTNKPAAKAYLESINAPN